MNECIKQHCPYCDKTVNCEILCKEVVQHRFDERNETDFDGEEKYLILKCCGCGERFMAHIIIDFDFSYEDDAGEVVFQPTISYLPVPPSLKKAKFKVNNEIYNAIKTNEYLDSYLSLLYQQIIAAFNNDQALLAALGIRSLIDAACVHGAGGNIKDGFAKHLAELISKGFLPSAQKDLFDNILNIGHGATHRLSIPSLASLQICLEATEHLLAAIYLQPQRLQKLKEINK